MLLHTVTTVLGCLPWAEARTFHNLIMTKIEQGRINWKSNFSILANQFLEKKVRNSLRAKSTTPTQSKDSRGSRNFSRGFGNHPSQGRNFRGQGGPLGLICRQFNRGSCSYGDEQWKRWHVCLSCAEAGKIGEQHPASLHASSRGNQGV